MNKQEAIYTEETNCQDCYKCIRHCPVKAIKIENHSASIIHSQCIFCGKCVSVCPSGAKKLRNDVQTAKFLLKQSKPVILSLAPSYPIDFDEYSKDQLIYALKQLGFARVSETALGAEIVSASLSEWLPQQKPGVYISSCCPSLVHLILKYYPELSANITPFKSPAQVHASYLREIYGDVCIIFAGPCIAKKTELAYPDNNINLTLSFQELDELLQDSDLQPGFIQTDKPESFEPFEAQNGKAYPIDGGMLNSMKPDVAGMDASFMSFSGIENVKSILSNLPEKNNGRLFLELMTCTGGCINGPGQTTDKSIARNRLQIIENCESATQYAGQLNFNGSTHQQYNFLEAVNGKDYPERLIIKTLSDIGKNCETDELNCGGCGYFTCRQFAKAVLDEKAESQMCVSYMRRMAQNKASVLL
ncbi:MAG: 4Fe-4S binding protein, partial [Bacteroidales bacterium]|nr:4Fe-4S binding protein [Bacteroidales bacterium]